MVTAREWLEQNDPNYVKPAIKVAATKRIPFTSAALEAMYGSRTAKINGRYVQVNPIAFVGSADSRETVAFGQPGEIKRAYTEQPIRRRGKRGGKKH